MSTRPETVELIETLRVEPDRRAPLLAGHLTRLRQSCAGLSYAWPEGLEAELVRRIAGLDAGQAHRLRVLVDRAGHYTITEAPLPPVATPLSVMLVPSPRGADPFWARHKTTYHPWYDAAWQWLPGHPDVFDLIYCEADGLVREGSRSNIYWRNAEGHWLTPPISQGVLPGVQRQALLSQGLVREAEIPREALLRAPPGALRLSNALRGWQPVTLLPGAPAGLPDAGNGPA